jgi:Pectate lyase superfamily protein
MSLTKTTYAMTSNAPANVMDYGAFSDGTNATATTAAIVTAIASGAKAIYFPRGTYAINSKITASINTRFYSECHGMLSPYGAVIKYVGSATSDPMFYVPTGENCVEFDGFYFDANSLARTCVHFDTATGYSTQMPVLRNCYFVGYTSRGVILGGDSISVLNAGQMQEVILERLSWRGGNYTAIGLLINAQNLEFAVSTGLYFDPDAGSEHSIHVYAYAGGFNVQGLVTTRSTQCAIYGNGSQIIVNGWRSEDLIGMQTAAVGGEGPCTISGLLNRGSTTSSNDFIDFRYADTSLNLFGCQLKGNVRIANTNDRAVNAVGIDFAGGADYIFEGPANTRGVTHNATTGEFLLRGNAAAFETMTETGTSGVKIGLDQITILQNVASASAANLSIYVNTADGKLYFKDSGGTSHALY